jgi:hypothetical protein
MGAPHGSSCEAVNDCSHRLSTDQLIRGEFS